MRISTDTITWTTESSNFPNNSSGDVRAISYGSGLWVAGGNYGQIRTNIYTESPASWSVKTLAEITAVNTSVKTSSYTIALLDAGGTIEMNSASANTVTIPLNASAAFTIGTTLDIIQYGAGQTTIVATGGVTLRSKGAALKLTGQYSGATLYKRGTDEWVIIGDLTV
jgi:hypothetical protein